MPLTCVRPLDASGAMGKGLGMRDVPGRRGHWAAAEQSPHHPWAWERLNSRRLVSAWGHLQTPGLQGSPAGKSRPPSRSLQLCLSLPAGASGADSLPGAGVAGQPPRARSPASGFRLQFCRELTVTRRRPCISQCPRPQAAQCRLTLAEPWWGPGSDPSALMQYHTLGLKAAVCWGHALSETLDRNLPASSSFWWLRRC